VHSFDKSPIDSVTLTVIVCEQALSSGSRMISDHAVLRFRKLARCSPSRKDITMEPKIERFDAIIVGGGLGGLVAGSKLAKEGKRVLLIEQHRTVGGFATTFRRKDYTIEVSLHEMDGLDEEDMKLRLFEELDVLDNVEFIRVPQFYRFVNKDFDFVMPDSAHEARGKLIRTFPDEVSGIDRFFSLLAGIRREGQKVNPLQRWKHRLLYPLFPLLYPNLTKGSRHTIGDFLERSFHDERLKLLLAANVGYYGNDPFDLSLLFYAMAQGSYFAGGGHYIKGGSQHLSDHFARFIRDHNGTVLTSHEVTRVHAEDGKVTGVSFFDKRSGTEHNAHTRTVIANAAIPTVLNELLPVDAVPVKYATMVAALKPSTSILSIYLGFSVPPKELGNVAYSTFIYENVTCLHDLKGKGYTSLAERPFVFCDYSQIESGLAPAGKSVGFIGVVDSLSDWQTLSPEEYQRKKKDVAQLLIGRLEKLIPGISAAVDYCEVGTPKTIVRFTKNPYGSIYGFAQTMDQTGLKRIAAKSSLDGLYFASAWAFPGGGFSGAMLGGYLAALQALKDGL
jgi:all-trans-retinol 13,14-reductase